MSTSATRTAFGSSIWYHMPGTCWTLVAHRVLPVPLRPSAAVSGLWLAVAFHSAWFSIGIGVVDSSSA